MQDRLIDRYGRQLDYLRLSVMDRCNLRCYYCMPEEGMPFAQRKDLLSWNEMYLLTSLFTELSISKIRITGGEPYGDEIIPLPNAPNATSINYKVTGYEGSFGIIPSYSRTFCGTCNRIRLSATGELRTCLYAASALNLRDAIRSGAGEDELKERIASAVANRAGNGFEAEQKNQKMIQDSMSALGG